MRIDIGKDEFKIALTVYEFAEKARDVLKIDEPVTCAQIGDFLPEGNAVAVSFRNFSKTFSRKEIAEIVGAEKIVFGKWGKTKMVCGI